MGSSSPSPSIGVTEEEESAMSSCLPLREGVEAEKEVEPPSSGAAVVSSSPFCIGNSGGKGRGVISLSIVGSKDGG
jgi:hypothetical protein